MPVSDPSVLTPGVALARPIKIEARAGVGFKPEHAADIEATRPDLEFFEIHAENYMGAGGPPHAQLARLRREHALSVHGVGLSIGGEGPLDLAHLARLRALIERYEPALFSEHLAWSTHETRFFNDLLPLPYTEQTLARVCDHVDQVQEALGRRMLLENPATYVLFEASTYAEVDFLSAIAVKTGCGLLLDVNNVHVCATNHGFDAADYIDRFPIRHVEEIHLAGFARDHDDVGAPLLIDAHCAPVADPVWALLGRALARRGPVPTLIEWDNDLPDWQTLYAEAQRAERLLSAAVRRDRSEKAVVDDAA